MRQNAFSTPLQLTKHFLLQSLPLNFLFSTFLSLVTDSTRQFHFLTCKPRNRAASSTIPPRAQFTMRTPSLHFAIVSSPTNYNDDDYDNNEIIMMIMMMMTMMMTLMMVMMMILMTMITIIMIMMTIMTITMIVITSSRHCKIILCSTF